MSGRKLLTPLLIRSAEDFDPRGPIPIDGWYVEMPVGSEVAAAGQDPKGQAVVYALVSPGALRIRHPLIVLAVGEAFDPKLGRKIGRCFGPINVGVLAFVFEDAPWPTSTLVGIETVGAA
jgi:hypothetical protein